jgi:hypothetical protein
MSDEPAQLLKQLEELVKDFDAKFLRPMTAEERRTVEHTFELLREKAAKSAAACDSELSE